MSYFALLDRLYRTSMGFGVKLGLENCRRMAALLGHPEKQLVSIHIAGTNGKGSVSHKIAAALEHTGKKVGLYTSPHISSFRERIRINGKMIPELAVSRHLSHLFSLIDDEKIPATFFELTTMMAFIYFVEEQVDMAVIETGLGGRQDATNILEPILTVITSLGFDHMEILGESLEEIAREKLGIAKSGVPLILGARLQEPFLHLTYEEENCLTAKCALAQLSLPETSVAAGLASKLPCRFEILERQGITIILDVAHNPAGFKELLHALRKRWPHRRLHCLVALSKNKDHNGCLLLLRQEGAFFYLFHSSHPRLACPSELAALLPSERTHIYSTVEEAIETALNRMATAYKIEAKSVAARSRKVAICEESIAPALLKTNKMQASAGHSSTDLPQLYEQLRQVHSNDLLLICGSFFMMSEVRQVLGMQDVVDAFNLNENFIKG